MEVVPFVAGWSFSHKILWVNTVETPWKFLGVTWSGWWWLVAINFLFSHKYWVSNHPNWRTHIFQRGSNHQPVIVIRFISWYLVSFVMGVPRVPSSFLKWEFPPHKRSIFGGTAIDGNHPKSNKQAGYRDTLRKTNRLLLKMAIEILDVPLKKWWLSIELCERLPE